MMGVANPFMIMGHGGEWNVDYMNEGLKGTYKGYSKEG